MYKTIGIYKDISDSKQFEKYYVEEVMPRLITFPGVIKMKITNLLNSTREKPPSFDGIQFIIETHYETIDDLRKIVDTPEGKEIVRVILGNVHGKCGTYVGEGKSFIKKESNKQPRE
jgi:hypothetical protein